MGPVAFGYLKDPSGFGVSGLDVEGPSHMCSAASKSKRASEDEQTPHLSHMDGLPAEFDQDNRPGIQSLEAWDSSIMNYDVSLCQKLCCLGEGGLGAWTHRRSLLSAGGNSHTLPPKVCPVLKA